MGRALASTCLPAAILQHQQQQRGQQQSPPDVGGSLSAALALVEMARAFLAPVLAAATAGKNKDEMDIE